MAWSDKARAAAAAARRNKKNKTSRAESFSPTILKRTSRATISLASMKKLVQSPPSVRVGVGFGKYVGMSDVFGKMSVMKKGYSALPFKKTRRF